MGHIIICVAIGLSMHEKQSRPTVMLRRQWLYCLLSLYRRTGAKGRGVKHIMVLSDMSQRMLRRFRVILISKSLLDENEDG